MPMTLCRHALRAVLLLGLLLSTAAVVAGPADAMSRHKAQSVVHIAASKKGTPYRYGATGPRAFDCSGFTRYVFARVGRHLPRTSSAQARAVRHVSRSHRAPGDLVFFRHGRHVYHVGIYAGHGRIWHAPRTGERVHLERIWTRAVSYGRVR